MPTEVIKISKGVNVDLANERKKCNFEREELARYWIGDEQKLQEKRSRGKIHITTYDILNEYERKEEKENIKLAESGESKKKLVVGQQYYCTFFRCSMLCF